VSIERKSTRRGQVYEVRLRRPNGREYARTFATRREARAFEASERATRNNGSWIDPSGGSITFEVWASRWLQFDVAKAPGTRATDTSIIRSALVPALGSRPLNSIRPLDIQDLVAGWCKAAKPRTVRRRYATLSAILNDAVDKELIGRSPCRGVRLPPVSPARHQIVGPRELERLAAELPAEYRTMLYLGATLGLRLGEVAGLRVRSVDLARRTLAVTQSVGEAAGRLFTKGPKTAAARRTIPLPMPIVTMVRHHIEQYCGHDADALLFTAPGGGPLRPNHFRARVWRPGCGRAGLDGLGFHDLRRSAATVMVANGVSVRDAQQILGHSDPRLLLAVYAQATDAGMRSATEAAALHFAPTEPGTASAVPPDSADAASGRRRTLASDSGRGLNAG
jgi:integrase